jgi:peptidoglycan/xylan/chitin deacetylase (PgdA/CDA1 family)
MKKFLFALLYRLGATRFAAWWNRDRVVFLCYHGVTQSPCRSSDDPKGLHVNHLQFVAHLDFLQRHYNIISLGDYLAAHNNGRSMRPYSVVLTFDDGFRNFLTVAAPLLAAREIPATVFLITDKAAENSAGNRGLAWTPEDDQRYLSWSEAQMLKAEHGFEFGSHTCSHSPLLGLSTAETERELRHSFDKLITQLAVEKPTLSYPKGEFSSLLAADAQKLGYACALTTDRGRNEIDHDLFTLGRTLIGDDDDQASFAVRVSGMRWWLVRLMRGSIWRRPAGPDVIKVPVAAVVPSRKLMD